MNNGVPAKDYYGECCQREKNMIMMKVKKEQEQEKWEKKMYLEKAQLPHRAEPKAENLDQLSRLRSPREPRPLAWYFYLDFFLFCSSSTNTAKVTINRLDSEQLLFFREAFP